MKIIIIVIGILVLIIELIALFEAFANEKAFQKKGIKLLINYGTILTTKQMRKILLLRLNPIKDEDHTFTRIIVYKYRWQFLPFYMLRILGSHLAKNYKFKNEFRKKINGTAVEESCFACYYEGLDLIEIFEFNIRRLYSDYNYESVKVLMISMLMHELRHREQFLNNLDIKQENMESDADEYAIKFCNDKKNEISEILEIEEVYTLDKIEPRNGEYIIKK